MTSRTRTPQEKALDWAEAFAIIENALAVPEFEQVITALGTIPPPKEEDGIAGFNQYITAVNASLSIARIRRADARTAAIVAAMLTQSGVSRPTIDVTEE
jgi:hypothetical protein